MTASLPLILGVGNPLMEFIIIFKEIELLKNFKVVPGGSSLNTTRAAQFVLHVPKSVAFTGGAANNQFGARQRALVEEEGLDVMYDIVPGQPMGTCATLITDDNRCLIANLGAAEHYHTSHVFTPQLEAASKAARIIYCETYFVTVSMESLLILAHRCLFDPTKQFAFNLSAKWVVDGHLTELQELIPYADYIFGNEVEARTFAEQIGWEEKQDLQIIAQKLVELPKLNPQKTRVVVITQGPLEITLAYGNPVVVRAFDVPPIPKSEIKDTDGCGDSFVGGFLAAVVRGKNYEDAVQVGIQTAAVVIRQEGCQFPKQCDFTL
ncbi:MAG: adenosine kinase [Streblomastix strix]|uniref:Adenosine kinase n=1 Tax=Streblomastix strix TaxID=222440 RepID=A0A5J4UDJ0_9EUKA|nr:MAG: adenosine kinase [Streblomastix strix]